ncbi:MAG: hypothetical protein J6K29_11515 [Clostridia bacterium]|nr:hypothetical protein [Clostridia bacterium]
MNRKDREIARLRRELAAERRENARLERELSDLRRELQAHRLEDKPLTRLKRKTKGTHKEERLLEEANRRAHHYRKRSFLRYLWESVMESAPVAVIAKLWQYVRRVRVVQIILSLVLAVGAVVTVAILSAAALPFLFFGTALLTLLAVMRSRRMNRLLEKELTNHRIRILVPPRGASLSLGSFFIRSARSMASERGVAVLVVTPYLVSPRGLGGKGFFFTARRETEGLYLVRRHYFFLLRRRVLDALEGDVTVVY